MKSILLTLLLTQIVYADDDRLGVGTHFSQNWDPNAVMPLISGCGAGWIRDDVGWPDIERQKGVYSIPAKVKNWINVANRYGLKICIVFTYANKIYADPYDPVAYSKAVAWLAQALAGKVQAIEILNEPNNDFLGYSSGAWNGKQSDGSVAPWVAKYTTLLNLSVKAIKAVNPQMTVIGLGGAETPAAYRIIAQGIDPGVDALSDHPYQASNVPEFIHYSKRTIGRDGIAVADDLGTFASYVVMWRQQAAKYGASQKIWH